MTYQGGLLSVPYEPLPWAWEYHKARSWARTRMAAGGTGAGKTKVNAYELIRLAHEYGDEWMCVADILQNSYELQWLEINSMINQDLIVKKQESPQYVLIIQALGGDLSYKNKGKTKLARIRFQGSDEGNKTSERKKRGKNLRGVWCTEAGNISREVDNQLNLRARGSKPFGFYLYDTNPEKPNHHLLDLYYPKKARVPMLKEDSPWKDGQIIDFDEMVYWQSLTIFHNPELSEVEVRKTLKRYPKGTVWYDRMVLGRWVAQEGSIHDRPLDDYAEELEYV